MKNYWDANGFIQHYLKNKLNKEDYQKLEPKFNCDVNKTLNEMERTLKEI